MTLQQQLHMNIVEKQPRYLKQGTSEVRQSCAHPGVQKHASNYNEAAKRTHLACTASNTVNHKSSRTTGSQKPVKFPSSLKQ